MALLTYYGSTHYGAPPSMIICLICVAPEADCTAPEKVNRSALKEVWSPVASASHWRGPEGECCDGQPGAPSAG